MDAKYRPFSVARSYRFDHAMVAQNPSEWSRKKCTDKKYLKFRLSSTKQSRWFEEIGTQTRPRKLNVIEHVHISYRQACKWAYNEGMRFFGKTMGRLQLADRFSNIFSSWTETCQETCQIFKDDSSLVLY